MYQALYRKWRPKTFDEVIGQEHITRTLKKQVETGRLSHAYLFVGTRGTGKTTCARILAKAVNCENPQNGNPCGKCASCRAIDEGTALDIVEMDAASNSKVEDVRSLREEVIYSPASLRKRVYIIDEVHMLSNSAFNALLKIMEEPPEHLVFILATTELNKVPATILSRCQKHSFKRIETSLISDQLMKIASAEGFMLQPDAAALLGRLSEGGMRDAISLLDQCSSAGTITTDTVYDVLGLAGNREIVSALKCIKEGKTQKAIEDFNRLWSNGKDPSAFLNDLTALIRDVLLLKIAPGVSESILSSSCNVSELREFADSMGKAELIKDAELLEKSLGIMKTGKNPKTEAELCLISLCEDIGTVKKAESVPVSCDVKREKKQEKLLTVTDTPEYSEGLNNGQANNISTDEPRKDVIKEEQRELEDPWEKIKAVFMPGLKQSARSIFDNSRFVPEIKGNSLVLNVTDDFLYGQLNRTEVTDAISSAASRVLGREISASVTKEGASNSSVHNIKELSRFPEVKFI